VDRRYFKKLNSGFLWLAFSLTFTLMGCQAKTPATGTPVENQASAFTLPSSDGGTVSLSDYAGQPVLLYFHMANG